MKHRASVHIYEGKGEAPSLRVLTGWILLIVKRTNQLAFSISFPIHYHKEAQAVLLSSMLIPVHSNPNWLFNTCICTWSINYTFPHLVHFRSSSTKQRKSTPTAYSSYFKTILLLNIMIIGSIALPSTLPPPLH